MMKENEIRDIYDGELVSSWEDGSFIYICFPWCTVNFPLENFGDIADELCELVQTWRDESEEETEQEVSNN